MLTTTQGRGVRALFLRNPGDDDHFADILKLYSGNALKAYRPQLIVEYYVP
jgi:hypothetical protein